MRTPRARLDDVAAARILHLLTVFRIPDQVHEQPQTAAALAATLRFPVYSLSRILRASVAIGALRLDEFDRYHLQEHHRELLSDHETSVAAEFSNNDFFVAWGAIAESVQTGRPAFELAFGMSFYDRLAQDPLALHIFQDHMRSRATAAYTLLLTLPIWPNAGTCVDVAGGTGVFVLALMKSRVNLRGVIFDRPEVTPLACQQVVAAQMTERCDTVSGDALQAIPAGCEAYVLASFLHNLNNETAEMALVVATRAMKPKSKLFVIERVLANADEAPNAAIADIWMMAMVGGRERMLAEYVTMATRAGLRLVGTSRPKGSELTVMEFVRR